MQEQAWVTNLGADAGEGEDFEAGGQRRGVELFLAQHSPDAEHGGVSRAAAAGEVSQLSVMLPRQADLGSQVLPPGGGLAQEAAVCLLVGGPGVAPLDPSALKVTAAVPGDDDVPKLARLVAEGLKLHSVGAAWWKPGDRLCTMWALWTDHAEMTWGTTARCRSYVGAMLDPCRGHSR